MDDFQFWIVAYVGVGAVCGLGAALAIWIAAIGQSGLVIGGTVGLVPAYVGGMVIGFAWPIFLGVGYFWRRPVWAWIQRQFEPRQRLF